MQCHRTFHCTYVCCASLHALCCHDWKHVCNTSTAMTGNLEFQCPQSDITHCCRLLGEAVSSCDESGLVSILGWTGRRGRAAPMTSPSSKSRSETQIRTRILASNQLLHCPGLGSQTQTHLDPFRPATWTLSDPIRHMRSHVS